LLIIAYFYTFLLKNRNIQQRSQLLNEACGLVSVGQTRNRLSFQTVLAHRSGNLISRTDLSSSLKITSRCCP